MGSKKRSPGKRYFTVAEANAALPLVKAIARDIAQLAHELRERHERLGRIRTPGRENTSGVYDEEIDQILAEFERGKERMREYEQEMKNLGVELKEYYAGLVDFPSRMDGRDVYLCWRLGEEEVAYWHEMDAGFAGRQKLVANAAKG
jgi:hypothetical protein